MTHKAKTEIRKLGFVELKALIKEKSAEIDKLSKGFNVSIGLEGMKKHAIKARRIKEAAEAIEFAATCLRRGMSIEEREYMSKFIDGVMKSNNLLEELSE